LATSSGAVTGGTGAYANARGVFVSKDGKAGSVDTITLADWGTIMEKTIDRHAVDIAPGKVRPGLARALALLSVPGSTLAWELPSGGLWIGLPLSIAAIVLAIRARAGSGAPGRLSPRW
jgi:hypothetical protein